MTNNKNLKSLSTTKTQEISGIDDITSDKSRRDKKTLFASVRAFGAIRVKTKELNLQILKQEFPVRLNL